MNKFAGVYTALLTPFHNDGTVRYDVLRKLIRMNLAKGVDGFYVCGSTAEALMLSVKLRQNILDTVLDEAGGKCRIFAHVGCISQHDMLALAQHAQAAGADVISAIAPFYYGFSSSEIMSYYTALADCITKPVLLYYFPQNSGVTFTIESFSQYFSDKRFLGVKYTCNDLFQLERLRAAFPNIAIFNGYDELFLSGQLAGANGGIGSTYNFMAEKFINIRKLLSQGNASLACEVQSQANAIIALLCKLGVMPAEKAVLELMGLEMGDCLAPFRKVTDEERTLLKRALLQNGIEL